MRVIGLVVAFAIISTGCGSRTKTPPSPPTSTSAAPDAVTEPPQPSPYVGIDRCTGCHRERVEEFRETRHFLACVEAPRVPMPPGFDVGRNRYASHYPGVNFEMSRSEGQFWMSAIRQTPQGDERRTSRIDLVYGHGAGSDEAYFSWQGERVYELPMVWLHPQECWAATPINPLAGGDFSRPLTAQCLNCHNTWIDCVPGAPENFRRETALLGVTCERCHGPGREHVDHHERHRDDRQAQAIVHPGKLSRERLIDLCAQCHDNAIRFRRPPFSYRPGEDLNDFVKIPEFPLIEDNHVANQNGGMQASQCFQQSDELTCVTCHNPHRHRSAENAGAASCVKCHQPADCTERDRLPHAIQGNCIDCHMPPSNKVQVNFRTEQDGYVPPVKRWEHRIAVYPEARDAALLQWLKSQTDAESLARADQLTRSLGQEWRRRGAEFRSEYRFLMAIDAFREAQRIDPSEDTQDAIVSLVSLQTELDSQWFRASQLINDGRLAEAIELMEAMLASNPRAARVHGRLGTVYAAAGDKPRGLKHLQTANELDPNDSYGHGMLGWLAYLDGRFEEALQHFEHANDLEPSHAKLRYQLGLTLQAMKRWPEAATAFHEALAMRSDHLEACVALARVYQEQRRWDDAIVWAQRAVELTGENDPNALMFLSECLRQAGRLDDARRSAEQARQAAINRKPPNGARPPNRRP